jgi:hypothetical protein
MPTKGIARRLHDDSHGRAVAARIAGAALITFI